MGIWSHLRGKYPERKIALRHIKERMKEIDTLEELESTVAVLYNKKKQLERDKVEAEHEYTAASELLLEHWELKKTTQIKRDEVGTLTRMDDVHVTITNMGALKIWLKQNHLSELVQERVHSGSLSATIKELMKDGDPLPEGIELFTKSSVRVTKPKGDHYE